MTLESNINKNRYIGNGVATQFAFAFKVWKTNQVKVFVGNGKTENDVTSNVDINITASGGTVNFSAPPKNGDIIVIRRNMPFIQEDDYRNGSRFDGEEVEDRFDQDCAERQDLRLGVERSVKVPETSSLTGDSLVSDLFQARDDVLSALHGAGDVTGATQVIVSGTTARRSIQSIFSDILSVKDFGAKGDGVTDDTEAIQAAVNSLKTVLFPPGKYIVSSTIHDTARSASRVFWGFSSPSDTTSADVSEVVFTGDGYLFETNGIHVKFYGLNFTNTGGNLNTAIRFQTDTNADDVDGKVENCSFYMFDVGVYHSGRAIYANNNIFVGGNAIVLDWPSSGYEYSSWQQTPPFANRAVRIVNNRFHSGGTFIINDGDVLRGALIQGNVLDVGGCLVRDGKGLDTCLITGNVVDLSTYCLEIKGYIYNTVISNNIFSRPRSQLSYGGTWPSAGGVAVVNFQSSKIIGLSIENNVFQGATRRCIVLGDADADTPENNIIKNVSITGNIFDMKFVASGYAPTAIFVAGTANFCAICGNTLTKSDNSIECTLVRAHNTANCSISNSTITSNSLDGSNVVAYNGSGSNLTIETYKGYLFNTDTTSSSAPFVFENKTPSVSAIAVFRNADSDYQRVLIEGQDGNILGLLLDAGSSPFFAAIKGEDTHPDLGTSSRPWGTVFADTGTIQASDRRLKDNIEMPSIPLMNAWGKVRFKVFQMKEAIEKKGENARFHVGVIAQEVEDAFSSEGLDASRYGLFCHDEWGDRHESVVVVDSEAKYDSEGNEIEPKISHVEQVIETKAGDAYAIRYEEALALECAYLRSRMSKMQEQIDQLTAAVAQLTA